MFPTQKKIRERMFWIVSYYSVSNKRTSIIIKTVNIPTSTIVIPTSMIIECTAVPSM